ncbi:MAG: sigma-70 family RNA polymerase sigma factor [Chloroflexota bacterium]
MDAPLNREPESPATATTVGDGAATVMLDGDAFSAEIAPHLHLLHRTALRLTRDLQSAEDLLQDTLERAFVNFHRYQQGTNVRAWLLRIMNNVRISGYRYLSRRPQTAPFDDAETFSLYREVRAEGIAPGNVESQVLDRIGEESILRAIDALPEEFRMVVMLADVEGFSYKDMASILDVPIGTVTSRLYRGRKRLQAALWEHARELGLLPGTRGVQTR